MIKNKWFIGFVIVVIIIIVYILSGYTNTLNSPEAPVLDTVVGGKSTGTSSGVVSTQPKTTTSSKTSATNTNSEYVVYYTDNGFSPKQFQVPTGHLVKFINNSNKALMILADDTNNATQSELNQSKSIGRGGVYTFNFTITGVWSFHNANYPAHHGNIVVY